MDQKKFKKKKKTINSTSRKPKQRRRRSSGMPNILKSNEVFNISPYSFNSNSNASILNDDKHDLLHWGLPRRVTDCYASKGIKKLFDWQVECLLNGKVLEGKNLVYSAPTSAGKSMVSDILLFKQLLEIKRKALIILPFVSVTHEKLQSLKFVLKSLGVRVDAFAGNVNPRGGLSRVDVAICTIEKANNMINRLIEEKRLNEIGIIVVDELHMIGDSSRGYLLELLLTKVLYMSHKFEYKIQIVGMSATIPNLDIIAKWLDAELYITTYRPVPLYERVKFDDVIYDVPQMSEVKRLDVSNLGIAGEDAHTVYLAIETMIRGHGSLIFCATKAMCEKLCRKIATDIYEFGRSKKIVNDDTKEIASKILSTINANAAKIKEIIEQLRRSSAGLDIILGDTVKFGVAYHHAGLSIDERSIIEHAFRLGTIKILCATSTLSAGVNLPARLVIIKSPCDYKGSVMDLMTYKQMIGRAGRQGVDTMGESILITSEKDKSKAKELLNTHLQPIESSLVKRNHLNLKETSYSSLSGLRRGILEIIANGSAFNYSDVYNYIKCTFFATNNLELTESVINDILSYLSKYKLIYSTNENESDNENITPTKFGKAVLASGISPEEGLFIMEELNRAKQSICLSNDLHILYEVTPIYLSEQMDTIDWQHYFNIWNKLDTDMQKVGHLIGIRDKFIIDSISRIACEESKKTLSIHRRFYIALALHDLIQEVSLQDVARKFKCSKGVLQTLQQSASSFAGMLTVFCNKLEWHNLEILIDQFQSRLYFGVQRELIDLMRITSLNSSVARLLYNHKFDTVASLANVRSADIELILVNSGPFNKDKDVDLNILWIPGQSKSMNAREMAKSIVMEARELIEKDLGIKINGWDSQTPDIIEEQFSQIVVNSGSANKNEREETSLIPSAEHCKFNNNPYYCKFIY